MASLKALRASALGLLVGSLIFAPGCASEPSDPGFTLDENARLAPRETSDSAEVEDGKVSFARTPANEKWAAGLTPGNVIAGNWDSRGDLNASKNPYGFLRKVVSVKDVGDKIVIATEGANLNELLYGHLHIDSDHGGLPIFPDAPVSSASRLGTSTLRPLENGSGSGGNSGVKGSLGHSGTWNVDFHDATFNFDSHFEADYELKKWAGVPYDVKSAYSKFHTSASVGFFMDLDIRQKFTEEASLPLDMFKAKIPLGAGLVLEIGPSVKCGGSAEGKLKARTKAELKGELTAGFEYKDGNASVTKDPTSFTPSFTILDSEGGATVDLKCSFKLDATIYALDTVGISAALGPYGKIGAKTCTMGSTDGSTPPANSQQGVSFFAEEGIEFTAKIKVKTPIIPIATLEETLWNKVITPRGGETPRADSKCCAPGDGSLIVCSGVPLTGK